MRGNRDVLPPSPSQAKTMGPVETWALIAQLTSTLVRELEPQRLGGVERGLFEISARVTATTDLEMVVPELIHLLGGDGKALRALKMVSYDKKGVLMFPLIRRQTPRNSLAPRYFDGKF